jgi:CheY-like chemotaxis protein
MAKILVVDDEESLRELLKAILEEFGHEVLSAANGEQALKIMEQSAPVLVISDVMMPVMDGYVLVEQIKLKPEWGAIKVLLISAAIIDQQRQPKADEYLSKPYELEELEGVIERLLN